MSFVSTQPDALAAAIHEILVNVLGMGMGMGMGMGSDAVTEAANAAATG